MPEKINNKRYPDKELVAAVLCKDELAINYLLIQVVKPIIASLLIGKFPYLNQTTDEVMSDFYEKFGTGGWNFLLSFKFQASLTTYMRSIIYRFIIKNYISSNKSLHGSRKRIVALNEFALMAADNSTAITKHIDLLQIKARALEVINGLKKNNKSVMIRVLNDLTDEEIAKELKMTINSVQIIKTRVRQTLRDTLKIKSYDI